MDVIRIGLIGFGTIGSAVADYLLNNSSYLKKKTGADFKLVKIAEKERRKVSSRYKGLLVSRAEDIIDDPDINVVIELIGGIMPAKSYILKSFAHKKHVITANKALLAEFGSDLLCASKDNNVTFRFEAAVCGGVPIISGLSESLVANEIKSVLGIVNGTSNYILTVMEREGISMREALKIAQKKGYAERDPYLDLEGVDSAHKLAVLVNLAFGFYPKFSDIYYEGITSISNLDIKYALELGYRIKLLAVAKRSTGNSIEARVHPTLLPLDHILSSVRGVYNAVHIEGSLAGKLLFHGKGAGKNPTASAVIADLVNIAEHLGRKDYINRIARDSRIKGLRNISEISSRYYLRFMAVDRPGVLANISGILGRHNISIASVTQKEKGRARSVPIVMMTHEANEMDMKKAMAKTQKLKAITKKPIWIRVEG
ncbi:MAG: homoserine dehydrogenase [Candidatus Omnitrophica bacterium]|nr:homoserine dehydrogenase [Candidatus Omnitrophota bacterium]